MSAVTALILVLMLVQPSSSHLITSIHMSVGDEIDLSLQPLKACCIPKTYLMSYPMGTIPDVETIKKVLKHESNHPVFVRYVPQRTFKVYCSLHRLLSLKEIGKLGSVKGIYKVEADHKIGFSPTKIVMSETDGIFRLIIQIVPGTKSLVFEQVRSKQKLIPNVDILDNESTPEKVLIVVNCSTSAVFFEFVTCLKKSSLALASINEIIWIEAAQVGTIQNDIAASSVQSDIIGDHPIWDQKLTGSGQIIHVSDTGLHHESCFFNDPLQQISFFPNFNNDHRKIVSYRRFINPDGSRDSSDANSHGTHVTGSICGSTVNSLNPMSKYAGLAPDAKVVFDDISGSSSSLLSLPNDLYAFFKPMHASGIKLSHASWGGSIASAYAIMEREVDEFAWDHPDHLFVVAAGNSGRVGVLQPSSAKNTLSIGNRKNSKDSQVTQNVAVNSAAQSTFDGRTKPEICTPGDPIHSASLKQCDISSKQGTSMAASFGTAGAAIISQYLNEGFYGAGIRHRGVKITPSASLLKAMLIHSTRHMTGIHVALKVSVATPPPPNILQGFGAMYLQDLLFFYNENVDKVLQKNFLKFINNATLSQDGIRSFSFKADVYSTKLTARPVITTLVWTDPPAAEGSTKALVNDLDLVLQLPNGTLIHPIHNSGSGLYDRVNVAEQIRIPSSEVQSGIYRVFVYGYHVPVVYPYSGQIFSLVVSAAGIEETDLIDDIDCPNSCSGHGKCDAETHMCICDPQFHHIDCSICSQEVWCHGNGICSEIDGSCDCLNHFTGDRCDRCADGWHGQNCDSDCKCGDHGHCDTTKGCICDPHFTGIHCELCYDGWTSSSPTTKDCSVPSHWCKSNEVIEIDTSEQQFGTIQINDMGIYPNSTRCLWKITGTQALTINILNYKMEKRYDRMWVYEGDTENYGKHVLKVDGQGSGKTLQFPGGKGFIVFESDFEGDPVGGITIEFSVPCTTCNTLASTGCDANSFHCVCTDSSYPQYRCHPYLDTTPTPVVPQYCITPGDVVACSGRGFCKPNEMKCSCSKGYIGSTCQTECPGINPTPCNNHGTCTCLKPDDCSSAICVCDAEFNLFAECQSPPDVNQIMNSYTKFSLPQLKWYIGIIPKTMIKKNIIIRVLNERVEQNGNVLPDVVVAFWELSNEAGVMSLADKTFKISNEAICISSSIEHQYVGIRVKESVDDFTQFVVELEEYSSSSSSKSYSSCSSDWESFPMPSISNRELHDIATPSPTQQSPSMSILLPTVIGFVVGAVISITCYQLVRKYKSRLLIDEFQ